ncbi:MAG: hypothetical protein PSV16_01450 [Flavobacterium sp.]|nr:hypothetical protein [Flavobacterium sp.]
MKSYFLSGLLLSVLFLSCKDNKKTETENTEATKPFTVTVNAIVEKDDIFQIFYNEDGGDNFAPADAITINVKGNAQPQDLVFQLPEDASPMALRFDIGGNKDLKQVPFKGFKIEYLGKKIESNSAEFFKYFYGNAQVELDTVNTVAKIKAPVDGNYDPILGSTVALKAAIEKLYKQ